jgi:hypothetical protein
MEEKSKMKNKLWKSRSKIKNNNYSEKANSLLNLITIEQGQTILKMAREISKLRSVTIRTILQEYQVDTVDVLDSE